MKIALFGKKTSNSNPKLLQEFIQNRIAEKVEIALHQDFVNELGDANPSKKLPVFSDSSQVKDVDFVFSFGGDGTLLNTARFVGRSEVPILGVNSGRMGFLTSVSQDLLESAWEELIKNNYKLDLRKGIMVDSRPAGLFGKENFGLNDITIHKSNTNEMITVHTYINGEFLNSYWGDGLIIASPTGSTAYSLSCGGPIILPNSNAMVITPVAPHSLTVRPVIVPDDAVLSFEIETRTGQALVAMDTRTELIQQKTEIAIRKADFFVKLVRLSDSNYLDSLRSRLMWGVDTRN